MPASLCLFFASISAFVGTQKPGNGSIIGEIVCNFYDDIKSINFTELNLARYVTIGANYSVSIGSDSFLVRTTGLKGDKEKKLNFKKIPSLKGLLADKYTYLFIAAESKNPSCWE